MSAPDDKPLESRTVGSATWKWMFCRISETGQPHSPLFFKRQRDAEEHARRTRGISSAWVIGRRYA